MHVLCLAGQSVLPLRDSKLRSKVSAKKYANHFDIVQFHLVHIIRFVISSCASNSKWTFSTFSFLSGAKRIKF